MKTRTFLAAILILGVQESALAHGITEDRLHDLAHEIEHHPNDPGLYVARGRVFRDSGEWDAALEDYRNASEIAPGYHEALYWQGEALFRKGEYRKAESVLERYLSHVPNSPSGHRLIGQAYSGLGDLLRAADHYDRSISHDENPPPQVYLDRVRILMNLTPIPGERIRHGLSKGLERHPANVAIIESLIEVDLAVKDYPKAIMHLERLPSMLKSTPDWLNRKAAIETLRGQPDAAIKLYRASLDRFASLPRLKQDLPAFVAAREQAERGLQALQERSDRCHFPNQSLAGWIHGGPPAKDPPPVTFP